MAAWGQPEYAAATGVEKSRVAIPEVKCALVYVAEVGDSLIEVSLVEHADIPEPGVQDAAIEAATIADSDLGTGDAEVHDPGVAYEALNAQQAIISGRRRGDGERDGAGAD